MTISMHGVKAIRQTIVPSNTQLKTKFAQSGKQLTCCIIDFVSSQRRDHLAPKRKMKVETMLENVKEKKKEHRLASLGLSMYQLGFEMDQVDS